MLSEFILLIKVKFVNDIDPIHHFGGFLKLTFVHVFTIHIIFARLDNSLREATHWLKV